MSRATAAVEALRKRNPDAIRLAEMVSFAAMVDRPLLRAARLALVPEADADAEADLWFSGLVQSRTADGIVLDREVAEEIRQQMKQRSPEMIEAAWDLTKRAHDPWLPPSLKLEEEVAYLSVSQELGARDRMAERIQSVVRAMLRGDRPGLAQWATRALAMFPSAVRDLPESKMLDAGARLRLGRPIETTDAEPLPEWLPLMAPSDMKRTSLSVELRERELVLSTPTPSSGTSVYLLSVPDTNPIVLEVRWEEEGVPKAKQVTLRRGETVRVPVGSELLHLRTIDGEECELREQPLISVALQAEVIDFSAEMARHTTFYGREEEVRTLLGATDSMRIVGEPGIGKTALLCELIRRLAPAPVFVHFFRAGEYRLESVEFAQRSIAAQIALRYRLDEGVVDLPLRDVLARLTLSPRCPSRLYILLDDVDNAREDREEEPGTALQRAFGFLPELAILIFSSRGWYNTAEAEALAEEIQSTAKERRRAITDNDINRSFHLREREAELTANLGRLERLHDDHVLELRPDIDVVRRLVDSESMVEQSELNPGKAIVLLAAAANSIRIDRFEEIADRVLERMSRETQEELFALAVARTPLPAKVFEMLSTYAFPLIHSTDGRVALMNGLVQIVRNRSAFEGAHASLVSLLERNRSIEDVGAYYARNVVFHLLESGNLEEALQLCLNPAFMAEVVRRCDASVMKMHLEEILEAGGDSHPKSAWARTALNVLRAESEAIESSPDELDSILRRELPAEALPVREPRLVQVGNVPRQRHLTLRRHDSPVSGCADVGAGARAVSWSNDGRLMFWRRDHEADPSFIDHSAAVTAVTVSGTIAVSGDSLGFLRVVDAGNYRLLNRFVAHDAGVLGTIAASEKPLVASWSTDGVIKLWRIVITASPHDEKPAVAEESLLGELSGHDEEVTGCAFAAGGRLLVSASRDGTIRTWNVGEQRAIAIIRNGSPVIGLAVSGGGQWLAAVDEGGNLRLATVEPHLASLPDFAPGSARHRERIAGIAISPDDRMIVTWANDGFVVWSVSPLMAAEPPILRFERSLPAAVILSAFVANGSRLLVSLADGKTLIFDLTSGGVPQLTELETMVPIRCVADGEETFITGDDHGVVIEWSLEDGRQVWDYSKEPSRIESVVSSVGLVLTGDRVSLDGGKRLRGLLHPHLHASGRNAVVWTEKGRVWRINSEDRTFEDFLAQPPVSLCVVDNTSRRSVAIAYLRGNIRVDIDGITRQIEEKRGTLITAMAFAREGGLFLFASDDGSIGFESSDNRRGTLTSFQATINRIEVDDARLRVATVGRDGSICIRSVDQLFVESRIRAPIEPSLGCRFSQDGRALVAALDRHNLGIWDPTSGERVAQCGGHRAPITGFDVGDGVIYSCSEDRTIRMWDDRTGEQLEVVYGYNAFRCISAHDDETMAGDDAGKVWKFRRGATLRADARVSVSASATLDEPPDSFSFISYSSKDREFATRLNDSLNARGIQTWLAAIDMVPGSEFEQQLNERLGRSTSMIMILSESSLRSGWLQRDVRAVSARTNRYVPIVAAVIDDTDPFESDFTYSLSTRVDFRNWRDPAVYVERLNELVARLQSPVP